MFKSALPAVNVISRLLPRQQLPSGVSLYSGIAALCSRSLSAAITAPIISPTTVSRSSTLLASQHLLQPASCLLLPVQSYKVKTSLYKRCKHCYFVRRQGRLFVECKAKGRHKQMQKMSKKKLFRE